MRPPTRIALAATLPCRPRAPPTATRTWRAVHSTAGQQAKVVPICGTGPPPDPPVSKAEADARERIARRRRQAEMLKQVQGIRAAQKSSGGASKAAAAAGSGFFKRRFWKDVSVKEVDGAYEIHLDTRPVRHPTTKAIIRLPLSKPGLAHALAVEWDHLTSATDATRQHLIPLTSLICRAMDIAADDEKISSGGTVRNGITTMLLRYLDTDSLLCWSPAPEEGEEVKGVEGEEQQDSLRSRQERTARAVVAHLTTHVWPGVEIAPVLDEASIMPRSQPPGTRDVVRGWVAGLSPWELAGLERATLASKGLLGAARLVAEWSEGPAGRGPAFYEPEPEPVAVTVEEEGGRRGEAVASARFGVEEAAKAASLEVDWQTGRWGEVEDTHDVEKEDLRRQLGSVVLLVSGTGGAS